MFIRSRSRTARLGLFVSVLFGLSALMISPAEAYYQHSESAKVVEEDSQICSGEDIYINDTAAYPYMHSVASFWLHTPMVCYYAANFKQTDIRTREDLYVWVGESSECGGKPSCFVACNYGPYVTNNNVAWQVSTQWYPNPDPCYDYDYYFDSGYAGYWNNSNPPYCCWVGGWTQTPNAVYVVSGVPGGAGKRPPFVVPKTAPRVPEIVLPNHQPNWAILKTIGVWGEPGVTAADLMRRSMKAMSITPADLARMTPAEAKANGVIEVPGNSISNDPNGPVFN